MKGKLTRYESADDGTFGVMRFGTLELHTIERPWLNNEPFKSCIPPGEYALHPFTRPNGDQVYALTGGTVSLDKTDGFRRYLILIHVGNYMTDVVGCIAPGMYRNGNMVSESKKAMMKLMNLLGGTEPHFLTIEFGEVNNGI